MDKQVSVVTQKEAIKLAEDKGFKVEIITTDKGREVTISSTEHEESRLDEMEKLGRHIHELTKELKHD